MNHSEKREYPLKMLYFYLTEGCNLLCRHCWLSPKHDKTGETYPSISPESFRNIIKQARPLGLSGVKLTGGEPLLHPRIFDILKIVKEEGVRLTVETNGTLMTTRTAEAISGCSSPFVSVSLDGVDKESHEYVRKVEGSFDGAVSGIKKIVDTGLKPQIIMTIMKHNYNLVEKMISLAETLGAGSIKFNLVQPAERGEKMHESGESLSVSELIELGKKVDCELSKKTKLKLSYSYPLAFRPLKRIFGDNGKGCGVCGIRGILGVLASGKYALCGIGEVVPELVFGNAESDPLEKIWKEHPILNELREGLPNRFEGVCGECMMKQRCLGSCIAQNYYKTRSLWAPFWFCKAAEEAGIFPENRKIPKR